MAWGCLLLLVLMRKLFNGNPIGDGAFDGPALLVQLCSESTGTAKTANVDTVLMVPVRSVFLKS